MNFELLLRTAASHANAAISVRAPMGEPVVRTFQQFVIDVQLLKHALQDLGLRARQLVALQASHSYEFIVWDLALIELGAIAQVFPEETSLADLQAKTADAGFACVIGEQLQTLVLPAASGDKEFGRAVRIDAEAPQWGDPDLLTRVYSSGTTGKLKGLEISRSGAQTLASEFIEAFGVTHADRHLIFLPLSHFQQRLSIYVCLWAGVSFTLTPFTHVFHDLPKVAPTFLIGPPVFYESLLAVHAATLMDRAAALRLVNGLGGCIRFMITGMAPIRRAVLETFSQAGVCLLEAYGITEIGLVAWNVPGANRPGTVGRPLRTNRIVVAPDSEILVHSSAPLTRRYFDVPAAQADDTFRPDGSIATGDIGLLEDGHVVLSGRKKDVIVTSSGQKFHPSEVELLLLECAAVRQAAIVCAGERQEIIAVLSVADAQGAAPLDALRTHVASVNRLLDRHKNIARVILTTVRFSAENGLLTRNLKLNRQAIARQFVVSAFSRDPQAQWALESV